MPDGKLGRGDDLLRFVPAVVHELGGPGSALTRSGAFLVADISGFTTLVHRLATSDRRSAEDVVDRLNRCFDPLVGAILEAGGDVISFAGDAVYAMWPDQGGIAAASRAGVELLRRLEPSRNQGLAVRVGVGSGAVTFSVLGGARDRTVLVVTGNAVSEALRAQAAAEPGGLRLGPGAARAAAGIPPVPCDRPSTPTRDRRARSPSELVRFLPAAARTNEGWSRDEWLSELRVVTALFVDLPGFAGTLAADTTRAAAVFRSLQEVIYERGGSLNTVNATEDGVAVLAAFGLPPIGHEDDARRGALTAVSILDRLAELGQAASCGVATGPCFCGIVGTGPRRTYTLIGDPVNVAARLAACSDREVLCDDVTRAASSRHASYRDRGHVALKGIPEPVAVHSPDRGLVAPPGSGMVGRQAELAHIDRFLDSATAGDAPTLVVTGEAGIGKSTLLEELGGRAARRGFVVGLTRGWEIDQRTALAPWRQLLPSLSHADSIPVDELRASVGELVADLDDGLRLLPLLNPLLPLDIAETDLTAGLSGDARSRATGRVVAALLGALHRRTPLLLIFDDAHWYDSASWALLGHVLEALPELPVALGARSLPDPTLVEGAWRARRTAAIALAALERGALTELVARKLPAGAGDDVAEIVIERCDGNPFYAEELAALLSSGSAIGDAIPTTLEGLITARMDRLVPDQKLTLRAASVIGRDFDEVVVSTVHPSGCEVPRVRDHLDEAEAVELVRRPSRPGEPWQFRHALTREVIYGQLLASQRRQLHGRVAAFFEASATAGEGPPASVLAQHWSAAGQRQRALPHLTTAGVEALQQGAYPEAVTFLEEALASFGPAVVAPARERGRLQLRLAEAVLGLGEVERGRRLLLRGLADLDARPPSTGWELGRESLRHVARQVSHRLPLGARRVASGVDALEVSRGYQRLAETYWFANRIPYLAQAGLAALNHAEEAPPSPELARALAMFTVTVGSIPLHRPARAYARRARLVGTNSGQSAARAYANFITSVYLIGTGAWEEVDERLRQAVSDFEAISEERLHGDALTVLAMAELYRGRFASASARFGEITERAAVTGNRQHHIWGLLGRAEAELRTGQHDRALRSLHDAIDELDANDQPIERLRAHGLRASARLAVGDGGGAVRDADAADAIIAGLFAPTAHYLLEGYAGVAETRCWQLEHGDGRSERQAAQRAVRRMHGYARIFPIGRPRAHRLTAHLLLLSGRRRPAALAASAAVRSATRLGMGHEQRLALDQLHRSAP